MKKIQMSLASTNLVFFQFIAQQVSKARSSIADIACLFLHVTETK